MGQLAVGLPRGNVLVDEPNVRQVLRLTILRSTLEDRHQLRNRRIVSRRRTERAAAE